MVIDILQNIVLILLAFFMFFGLGFILNMLLKTTWFPIYFYFVVMIGLLIYWSWGAESFWTSVVSYTLADYLPLVSGLGGAWVSGWTIRLLRLKGFKMF